MSKRLKDILREGEEQYDPKAWDNVSRRLDQLMPVKKPNHFSARNMFIAGASALFIGSGVFLFMNREEEPKADRPDQAGSAQVRNEKTPVQSPQTASVQEEQNTSTIQNPEPEKPAVKVSHARPDNSRKEEYRDPLTVDNKEYSNPAQKEHEQTAKAGENRFVLPKHASEYCLNEEIELYNTNQVRCLLTDESGNVLAVIAPNGKTKVQLTKAGAYFFRYPKSDLKDASLTEQEKAFAVHEVKVPDFSYERELTYENGIPYIQLKADYFSGGMGWSSDKGEISEQAETTRMTAFRKGDYKVSLERKDQSSCVSRKTQVIHVQEEYNLLAPTAFKPASNDPRNNHFMPFALSQRNTAFELIIIDPESGRTVFKSTSAENAWDGSDMTSEQSSKVNRSYIWKVRLMQPERGEKSEYSGTVVRLIQ